MCLGGYVISSRIYQICKGAPIAITERLETLGNGCLVLSGIDTLGLLQSVEAAVIFIKDCLPGRPDSNYVGEDVSIKVVRIAT